MKDYKYLVANGCSFVQGSGIYGPLGNNPVKNIEGRFSDILSKKLNCQEINFATGGAGNDKIVRTTFEWVEQNKEKLDTLIILGLSHWARKEIWVNEKNMYDKFKTVQKYFYHDEFVKKHLNYEQEMINLKRNLTMLDAYIKQVNPTVDLLIFGSFKIDNLVLDSFNSFKFNSEDASWTMYIKKKRTVTSCSHPNKEAHKLFAEQLYDYLKGLKG